jgi:hypothetical protein
MRGLACDDCRMSERAPACLALFPSSPSPSATDTSTISSNSAKHSTPSTHSIHTRPRTTSVLSHTLVSVSEDHHGRQDGRRRGRLCSCRQRSYRRAAFTMYIHPSVLPITMLTCSSSHHRQLRPPRSGRSPLRWTLHSPCTSLNIEHAQEPSAPRRPVHCRCFALRLTPRLA